MNQRKKKIIRYVGISITAILLGSILLSVILLMTFGSIAKSAAEKFGPKILGAPVKIEQISLHPFSASIEVKGVFIGNPSGYKGDRALTVKTLRIDLLLSSLLSKKMIVEEFTLDGVDVYFEPSSNLLSNNLSQLNDNVQSFVKKLTGPAKTDVPETKTEKKPQALEVDRLRLTNICVDIVASAPGVPTVDAPIPVIPIVLENLGKGEDGITAADLTSVILNKLTLGVFSSVADALPSLKSVTDAGATLINSTSTLGKTLYNETLDIFSSGKK